MKATLSEIVSQCDCCGRDKLLKTFCIESIVYDPLYLGYKCCSRWFKLNMSGNKFSALNRLNWKLTHDFTLEELEHILGAIKYSQQEWMSEDE